MRGPMAKQPSARNSRDRRATTARTIEVRGTWALRERIAERLEEGEVICCFDWDRREHILRYLPPETEWQRHDVIEQLEEILAEEEFGEIRRVIAAEIEEVRTGPLAAVPEAGPPLRELPTPSDE